MTYTDSDVLAKYNDVNSFTGCLLSWGGSLNMCTRLGCEAAAGVLFIQHFCHFPLTLTTPLLPTQLTSQDRIKDARSHLDRTCSGVTQATRAIGLKSIALPPRFPPLQDRIKDVKSRVVHGVMRATKVTIGLESPSPPFHPMTGPHQGCQVACCPHVQWRHASHQGDWSQVHCRQGDRAVCGWGAPGGGGAGV